MWLRGQKSLSAVEVIDPVLLEDSNILQGYGVIKSEVQPSSPASWHTAYTHIPSSPLKLTNSVPVRNRVDTVSLQLPKPSSSQNSEGMSPLSPISALEKPCIGTKELLTADIWARLLSPSEVINLEHLVRFALSNSICDNANTLFSSRPSRSSLTDLSRK